MTRREEIINNIGYKITKAAVEYYQANCANDIDLLDAFEAGAEWMQETMIERLRELKCGYEKDLDAEPRVYERDIQLCAKISLIERLILELKEE